MEKSTLSHLHKISAFRHFAYSIVAGVVVFFASILFLKTLLCRLMLAWDICCLVQIATSFYIFFKSDSKQTVQHANMEDPSRGGTFVLVLLSALAGLLAVFILLVLNKTTRENTIVESSVAFAGMFLSWFMVHTVFATRYTHIFYEKRGKNFERGLQFPEDDQPDFMDFAYYSFVLGMTFQVSDTDVTSKRMRRMALLHGLIAFMFNTFIVALTINSLANING